MERGKGGALSLISASIGPGARWALLAAGAFCASLPLGAHPANLTAALFRVEADGRYALGLDFDALAFAIDDLPGRIPDAAWAAAAAAPEAERAAMQADMAERWRRGTVLEVDGRAMGFEQVSLPPAAEVFRLRRQSGLRIPVLLEARASGRLPSGRHRVRLRFPEVIGTVVVTYDFPGQEPTAQPAEAGEWTAPVEMAVEPGDWVFAGLRSWGRFVGLGFRHIVPEGLDHILFVVGLFLLGGSLRGLLGQVTAFTLAHSVTLGLALYGVCRLPPKIVEPLIAISIVLIAVDNLRSQRPGPRRYALVFGFGLVHGLGFAGALLGLGLARRELAPALAGFNVGIELGQLAVIAVAFALVGWLRSRPIYRSAVVVPASCGIGIVALAWTIQRVF